MLQEIEADEGEVEYEEMIERSPCGSQALTTSTLKENGPECGIWLSGRAINRLGV